MKKLLLPIIAGLSGMGASVEAGVPDSSTFDAIGRWPLTVILGSVCVVCVYFMYKQSKDNADRSAVLSQEHGRILLSMIQGEREATEKRIGHNAEITRELAENNSKALKELAENHNKEVTTLLNEISKGKT